MQIIECSATRSYALKVPKLDYHGDERYRPHEEVLISSTVKAAVSDGDDVVSVRGVLQGMVDSDVRIAMEAYRQVKVESPSLQAVKETRNAWFEAHKNPKYPQGGSMPAGKRRCESAGCLRPLNAAGWNYSINKHGRPVCKEHE